MRRFTATEKWEKPWFQELPPHLKCLWLLMCDRADAAGVWEPNWRVASMMIGKTVSKKDLKAFEPRIHELTDGKLQILNFLEFQYGELSTDCRAHFPIFRLIEKHEAIGYRIGYPIGYPIPIEYPTGRVLDTLQEKEKDKEQEKETEGRGMQGGRIRADLSRGTETEIVAFCVNAGLPESDGVAMFNKWESNGWKVGGAALKNWQAAIRQWKAAGYMPSQKQSGNGQRPHAPSKPPADREHADTDIRNARKVN